MDNLFEFEGRIGRGVFFVVSLAVALIGAVLGWVAGRAGGPAFVICLIVFLPVSWVGIAASVKRCHDLDLSGWWVLIQFIPLVNILFGLYLLLAPGARQDNRFGASLYPAAAAGGDAAPTASSGRTVSIPAARAVATHAQVSAAQPVPVMDERTMEGFYAQVAAELAAGERDAGLWTRLYVECGGDERATQLRYIRLRVERLSAGQSAAPLVPEAAEENPHNSGDNHQGEPHVVGVSHVGAMAMASESAVRGGYGSNSEAGASTTQEGEGSEGRVTTAGADVIEFLATFLALSLVFGFLAVVWQGW